MKASIQISKHSIKVIAYTKAGSSISVKAYHTHPLPEECVMNGVIIDSAPVIEGLNALKSQYPLSFNDASLVLDGSFVYTKRITVPGKLNARMYNRTIRDEFSEVSSDIENLICTYFPLITNEDGSKQILACGIENAHAQTYLTIFRTAGIKLSSVHLGVQALLRYISSKPDLANMPFVLSVVDDVIMLSTIFHNGVNMFQSRTRLYGEDRSTLVRSTLDSLSGIVQFNKSQNFEDLTHYFYMGLSPSDLDLVITGNTHPSIRFAILDIFSGSKHTEMLPPDAHFAFLNALMPDSEPDLFHSIKQSERLKRQEKPRNIFIPIGFGLTAVLAVIFAVLWIQIIIVERDIRDLNNYLNNPAIIAELEEIDRLTAETFRMNTRNNAVDELRDEIDALPHLSRQLIATILRVGGTRITFTGLNFSSADAVIRVSAVSATEIEIANYVERLKRESIIDSVYYTGFNIGSDGLYNFSIDVVQAGWREEEESDT
jgi:hypothetical protein